MIRFVEKMGAGMDKILPGLYVGSIRDSKDQEQIKKHNITHIVSIHEDAKEGSIQVRYKRHNLNFCYWYFNLLNFFDYIRILSICALRQAIMPHKTLKSSSKMLSILFTMLAWITETFLFIGIYLLIDDLFQSF